MTREQKQELEWISADGRSADTDFVFGPGGANIRALRDENFITISQRNVKVTWLTLTESGRAALANH